MDAAEDSAALRFRGSGFRRCLARSDCGTHLHHDVVRVGGSRSLTDRALVADPEVAAHDVAEDRDKPYALTLLVEGGCGDHFKVYVRSLDRVDEREVPTEDFRRRDGGARKVGGEEQVIHL